MGDERVNALYVVATWVPRRTTIVVGSLGPVTFDRGWYAYVGSARRAREARVARHLRADKPLRWHADHLFARFPGRFAWTVDGELTECELAGVLARLPGAARRPPRFGAGDCRCAGHLAVLAERPRTSAMAGAASGARVRPVQVRPRGRGAFDSREYAAEAEGRWGGTEAYAASARRTALYTKADWKRVRTEGDEITAAFVAALDQGLAPEGPSVQAVVERHWKYLERWFCTPTPEMYAGLGDLCVDAPRFTKNIDKARKGLAAYQRAAMRAFAKKAG